MNPRGTECNFIIICLVVQNGGTATKMLLFEINSGSRGIISLGLVTRFTLSCSNVDQCGHVYMFALLQSRPISWRVKHDYFHMMVLGHSKLINTTVR